MDSIVNNNSNLLDYQYLTLELASLFDEHKAENTIALEVSAFCSFADYFIITTARSLRHLSSLVLLTKDFFLQHGLSVFSPAGEDSTGWALLDAGNIIVHIMDEQKRDFYELEKLWFQSKVIYSSKSS